MNIKKFLLGSAILVGLTGCNMSAQDGAQGGTGATGVTYDTQKNTGTTNVTNRKNNNDNETDGNEVLQVKNGYITIDPNSYMTSIPSDKFPHSEAIKRGQFKVYKFDNRGGQGQGQAAAPQEGGQEQAQQTPQQQAPEQTAPTPPANEQQQAPQQQLQPEQQAPQQQQQGGQANQGISEIEAKVIELTNAERRKNGLSDLNDHLLKQVDFDINVDD